MDAKIALVTGSSKGIGQEIAVRLGREGYHTYVTYNTDKNGAQKTADSIKSMGGSSRSISLDVRSEKSVKAAFDKIADEYGHLNVLVNNAGIEIPKNIDDATFEEWKSVTETQIDGCFLCTKYAHPLLKKAENPNVIFITSSAGDRPSPDYVAYCVGKAGMNAFGKAMALYLSKDNIRTNIISPGETRTAMWNVLGVTDDASWAEFGKSNPMKRVSTPEDIANAVMLVINDPSCYLNGNFIYVNGGGHLK